jgi:4'-phosphopantetheinyl transferase EntD
MNQNVFNEENVSLFFLDVTVQNQNKNAHFFHEFLGSDKRLFDYKSGRYCAAEALRNLGLKNATVLTGIWGEPIWPNKYVGSISHCDQLIGAVVALKEKHFSLGIDIEEVGKVNERIWDLIFTENEKNFLRVYEGEKLKQLSTIIFSIKESFYKFQFPITNEFLDFLDVEVDLPSLSHVRVLNNRFSNFSHLRKNMVEYQIHKSVIITLVFSAI